MSAKTITFRIRRFTPGVDPAPRWQDYRIEALPGMTVLDGLWKIKETAEPGLAWRFSCRMGICGSCGMMINGRPRLACNTQIAELESELVSVAPLPNFDILRDLVPDLQSMFAAHRNLAPWIIREDGRETVEPTTEYWQSPHELEQYLQFSYCIKCGCCMAACPTLATDPTYSGPQPLAQAHRYNTDTRDAGFASRLAVLSGEAGPWGCHFAGECSQACPKGVDPARAIQLLKRQLVLDLLHLRRGHEPAPLMRIPREVRRRDGVPDAPPRTVRT
ncbi:MAG: succinate dehydrogenase iron-sulfur subunit [Acidobacteria bacterium]|jgi:succinate dehydrogenase / fumarate reductase iron-sulfur subunit|nr:succinate dehydrogenase iron-sulfur subunit [Acidobacteriota bacterium]